ncbi:hemerythrin domain-containing protein [Acidovorax sp. Leaf160]|uniref:hemerythrin domain-containing protein n=1 Tax=Acidovorax sp. Leaf160 TaxID=1736280 RepID=UPI000701C2C8|nr:hemerythrin domain-containing protein [Acidovorax sp. Leaf160]KQR42918.1 hemerythrin [Acidovorax sp. Leaf160]
MTRLEWSDRLALELPVMDATHQEFVELLAAVQESSDGRLLPAWQALVEHTTAHFGQEDRWMQATRFASGNCHALQHRVILQVLGEGTERAQAHGELHVLRTLASELAAWFPQHTQTMDAALALHLRRVGFDPATGHVLGPAQLPAAPIEGCGGACSTAPARAPARARARAATASAVDRTVPA